MSFEPTNFIIIVLSIVQFTTKCKSTQTLPIYSSKCLNVAVKAESVKMLRFITLLCLSHFLIVAVPFVKCSDEVDYYDLDYNDNEFDVIIFTQQWPVTTCFHYMEEDHKNECNLPTGNEFWTIHGLWPTRYGTVGPSFCNKTADFDINLLDPIKDKLDLFWPTIQSHDSTPFWKHEWLKHGTCAANLTKLDNEQHYFAQGLKWREKYLISNILNESEIYPDSAHTVISFQNALKKILDKNPSIHCIYDRQTETSYLSEVRICFNKTLDLIDCDGIPGSHIAIDYPGGKVITNCHISKPVLYPSKVPPVPQKSWKFPFVNLYKLLNFVMWFTL